MRMCALALTLAASSLLVGCPEETDGTGGGGEVQSEPAWQVIFDEGALDRALLSVWGTSSKSVYVAGGPLGNSGFDALAMRYDGDRWRDLKPGGAASFWWVHGTADDDVWFVGESGRITHFDGAGFVEHTSGTTATLFGVMALSRSDVWAVGGTVGATAQEPNDVVLHYDGSSWSQVTLPGAPKNKALFKVWGTSSDELFIVGEAGVIWQKKGASWVFASDPPLASGTLTTVHGCSASDVYAVGTRNVLHYDGGAWTKVDRPLTSDVNGVFCGEGTVALVGMGGLKQRFDGSAWAEEHALPPYGDLHSVWRDDTGALWAVGGAFVAKPQPGAERNGIVTRYGPGTVTSAVE